MKSLYSLLILAAAFTIVACGTNTHAEPEKTFSLSDTMLRQMAFAKAATQPVQSSLKLFGKITADNNRQAQVYPLVGGTVTKVAVELGDYVQQGQTLSVIRSGEVAGFDRERMDAISDVALAEKNLQVARELYDGKLNTERDVAAAERELEKARAEKKRTNEMFEVYRISGGSNYNVTAPISGFIINKSINKNMQLRSDNTEPLFSIAQINEVWVLANVNESDIGKIHVGVTAEINTIAYPERKFVGKVDKIFNVLDPETKAMKVRIRIPNAYLLLKPEMSATVHIQYQEPQTMVAIPSAAVIFDKSRNWVMVYHDRNKIETRPVEVYSQSGDITYIQSGLQPDETIITKSQLLVYDALND